MPKQRKNNNPEKLPKEEHSKTESTIEPAENNSDLIYK